ncbi:hypothetical protein [Bradyrhizobium sp. AZCC 2289]|uniref:hypothetical protein n=1 Tax=Bradyrhizobium sp. AZCC 2289 TaxID=3117026 RepID=UPI002FF22A18
MTEHVVDLGRRQFRPFLEAPCQGGEEGVHNKLQHEFARDRNIVSDFRQVFLHQLSEHTADFVDGDDAALSSQLDGRLSAPFAPVAAIGEIITGAIALLFLALFGRGIKIPKRWLGVWNAFGLLDLLTALTLAVLSVPGTAFRVFTEGPGTLVMGTLPWIFVPAMLVPVDLLVHVVIMVKLKSAKHAIGTMANEGAQ